MRHLFLLSILAVVLASCGKKPGNEQCIVPREVFLDMLVETHIADGIYANNYIKFRHHTDTANFFLDIAKKYGYSKACFDSTFKYYLTKPEDFEKLYDDVIAELNLAEKSAFRIQAFENDREKEINLYKGKQRWKLPLDGRNNLLAFDIPLKSKDTAKYTIVVVLRFLPHDGCENPRLTAYFWHDDGSRKGKRHYFPTVEYTKSQRLKLYSVEMKRTDTLATNIRGYIVNSDNSDDFRHLDVQYFIVYNDK
jgi:hypothetical protein